ncbi:MAG: hypothetical protein ACLFRG_08215 [Desulfococcaceae bacterium]
MELFKWEKERKEKKTKGFLHISGGRTIQGQISQVIIFFSCFFAEASLPEKGISRQNPPVSPPTIENRPRPTDSSCGSKTTQKANHVPIKNFHEKNADPTTLRPPEPILPSNRSGALRAGHFLAEKGFLKLKSPKTPRRFFMPRKKRKPVFPSNKNSRFTGIFQLLKNSTSRFAHPMLPDGP